MTPQSTKNEHAPNIDWQGQRVTVMGLGLHGGGAAVVRYLVARGTRLTVTDLATAERLADSCAALRHLSGIEWRLGEHREQDFIDTDCVVVNPAVPPGNRLVELALARGVQIVTEPELFLRACRAPVVVVTGSNGKSSTATMLFEILRHSGRRAWLGGNIGTSLLDVVDEIAAGDIVVLEMSSFQLAGLAGDAPWPRYAIVTGCTPNHLDWHGSWEAYRASKQRLLVGSTAACQVVVNSFDAECRSWPLSEQTFVLPLVDDSLIPPLGLLGRHQRLNARLAASMALHLGCSTIDVQSGMLAMRPLPHRLQVSARIAGRTIVNDSKSTSPAATLAALDAITGPVWLILGGADKQLDYRPLVEAVVARATGVAVYGAVGAELMQQFEQRRPGFASCHAKLAEAASWCWCRSNPGETILLSPAAPSTDQYRDFAARGEEFIRCNWIPK